MQSSAGLYFKSQYYSLFPLKELVIHYSFLFNSTLQRLSLFCLRLVLSHIFLASRTIKNYWSRKIKHNQIDSVHMQKLHHTEESASPTSSVKKWSLKGALQKIQRQCRRSRRRRLKDRRKQTCCGASEAPDAEKTDNKPQPHSFPEEGRLIWPNDCIIVIQMAPFA